MTRWPLCIAINHSCCHPHKCHSRLIYKPSMVGGCCIIALAIAFRGDSNPFFLGAMGSNELYIWNSKFICDFFLTFSMNLSRILNIRPKLKLLQVGTPLTALLHHTRRASAKQSTRSGAEQQEILRAMCCRAGNWKQTFVCFTFNKFCHGEGPY